MFDPEGLPVRTFYERRVAEGAAAGRELYAYFDPGGGRGGDVPGPENDWLRLPLGALEAFAFYDTFVMDQDWGSVGAYRVDADGTPTVAIWTRDDGGRCWLEVYADEGGPGEPGALLGAARAADGKVAWLPRDAVRRQVFGGDLPDGLLR